MQFLSSVTSMLLLPQFGQPMAEILSAFCS